VSFPLGFGPGIGLKRSERESIDWSFAGARSLIAYGTGSIRS
jgi:hypothetical protein